MGKLHQVGEDIDSVLIHEDQLLTLQAQQDRKETMANANQYHYVVIPERRFADFLNNNEGAFYNGVRVMDTSIRLDFYRDGKNRFIQQVEAGVGVMHDEHDVGPHRNDWTHPIWICDVLGADEESANETVDRIVDMVNAARRIHEVGDLSFDMSPLMRELTATLFEEWVINIHAELDEQLDEPGEE